MGKNNDFIDRPLNCHFQRTFLTKVKSEMIKMKKGQE